MTRLLTALGIAAAMTVAACSSSSTGTGPACPKVAVLSELSELVRFRPGAGRDLTDVELQAKFASFAFGCRYEKDAVAIEIDIQIEATRGPALTANRTAFEYFVAVTNPAGEITAKEAFSADLEFKGNTTKLVVADELAPRIPLIDRTSGANWGILLGLQLTDEQRDWTRRQKGR